MTIWAGICLVLFLITFFTTKERIRPIVETKSTPKQDFVDLLKNGPWIALFAYTLFHFAMLAYRGNAHYNYYHHYADPAAMFDFLERLGLTTPNPQVATGIFGTIFDGMLGYIAHGTRDSVPANVSDVFNSILNMAGFGTTIVMIMLTSGLSGRFGRKNVALVCFSLAAVNAFVMYLLPPTATWAMLALAITGSFVYAPTCAIMWAMYADAADYSEWQTGRRFTGMVFATIGFSLKSGLALGGAAFLWLMAGIWNYDTRVQNASDAVRGYVVSSSINVALLFVACVVCVAFCGLNKSTTLQMSAELTERRRKAGLPT
jgi:Na+/melibiose symporter-like transporter